MGWSNWFSDNGDSVSEKTDTHDDGTVDTHYLRSSSDGDKDDHSHVMVRENSSGSKTGHLFHGSKKK